MSPIPNEQAEPKKPEQDPQYWTSCPECGSLEHHFNTPGLYEIFQVCNSCGNMSENKHYLAGSPEAEAWKNQKEQS